MVGLSKAALVVAVVALLCGPAASGAASYTGPVSDVPWTPSTLPDAAIGVPYSATLTPAPPGAVQLAAGCDTASLTGFPPPPISFNDCARLPPGLTATGGTSVTLSGTPTKVGGYTFRLIVVWSDAGGADFYALQSYSITVSTSAASPPCRCESVGVSLQKLTFAGKTASLDAVLSLQCTGGSGRACSGAATLRAPTRAGATATWTTIRRPGDDRAKPVGRRGATVRLSCFGPCGGGATATIRLTLSGAALTNAKSRAGTRWTIVVLPSCAGQHARPKALMLRFDGKGRLT